MHQWYHMNIWYHWIWYIVLLIVTSFANFVLWPFPFSAFVLNLPLPRSPAVLSTCIFQFFFNLSTFPFQYPCSFHLFLPLYFFEDLLYHCSALANTLVLPLLLPLTLPMPLLLPLPFILVMSLSWCVPCFALVFPHPYHCYCFFSLPLTWFLPFSHGHLLLLFLVFLHFSAFFLFFALFPWARTYPCHCPCPYHCPFFTLVLDLVLANSLLLAIAFVLSIVLPLYLPFPSL